MSGAKKTQGEHLVFAVADVKNENQLDGVDVVANWLTRNADLQFDKRQSDYRGGSYCLSLGPGGEKICVQSNRIESVGDWTESDFADWPLLIYVSNTQRGSWVEEVMRKFDIGRWIRVK